MRLSEFDVPFALGGTPHGTIRTVHQEAARALAAQEVKDRYSQLGFTGIGRTPEEVTVVVKRELEKYRKAVTNAGIHVE